MYVREPSPRGKPQAASKAAYKKETRHSCESTTADYQGGTITKSCTTTNSCTADNSRTAAKNLSTAKKRTTAKTRTVAKSQTERQRYV